MTNTEPSLQFPGDLLRFLHWIFFRPFTLRRYLDRFDPPLSSAIGLFVRGWQEGPERRSLTLLASFYIGLAPWLLGFGLGTVLAYLGGKVNWLSLSLYLLVGILLSLTFSLGFCVAFLLSFSLVVTLFSSAGFTMPLGILFSFALGLAYGLMLKPAGWGLAGGVIYGTVFALISDPISGLMIGSAFLIGYFRLFLYVIQAPLAWCLSRLSARGNAAGLWRFQPLLWDELIWFPLPGLDRHLQALTRQNPTLASQALTLVKDSFRQGWAVKRVSVSE
jgi:hypothetical protein